MSGRGWPTADRQAAVTVPHESSTSENHVVATLPHARNAFFPSAPNIPKSATATWGPLNKNLMWKVTNSWLSFSHATTNTNFTLSTHQNSAKSMCIYLSLCLTHQLHKKKENENYLQCLKKSLILFVCFSFAWEPVQWEITLFHLVLLFLLLILSKLNSQMIIYPKMWLI